MDTTQTRHEKLALLASLAALLVGWLGSALFYNLILSDSAVIGAGFPLLMLALLIGGLVVAKVMRVPLRRRVLWLMVPISFFAGMVAVRAETTLMALNVAMTLGLGALLLHYLPLDKGPDEDSTMMHAGAMLFVGLYSIIGGLVELPWLRKALQKLIHQGDERTSAVLRGLMLAVPIVLVFTVLLASADAVFSDAIEGLLGSISNMGDLVGRIVFTLALAWGALGLIAYGAREPFEETPLSKTPTPQKKVEAAEASEEAAAQSSEEIDSETALAQAISNEAAEQEKAKRLPGLGMIETSIVLGSVIALFAVFVLIQFTYLFGGQANIRDGVTYADYARRGFFELVAVAVMVIGLGRYLHIQTRRFSDRATLLFRIETVALVGLTLVLLASAWRRMSLYEAAYGFTYLRLSIYVFMLALVGLFGFFLAEVFTRRKTLFAFGVLLVAIGYGVVLNAIGGEGFIAQRNIERYTQGQDLDICYLKTFSVDALPQMLTLLDAAIERKDEDVIQQTRLWLYDQQTELTELRTSSYSLSVFNVSRLMAQAQYLSIPRDERATWAETPYKYCWQSRLDR